MEGEKMAAPTTGEVPEPRDPVDPPTHVLEIVTARVEAMVLEARLLRAEVKASRAALDADQNARRVSANRFYITLALLIPMLLLGVAGTFINVQINRHSDDTLDRLNDCLVASTNPDSCYAVQAERTAQILGVPPGGINSVTRYTITCSKDWDTDDDVLRCINAKLKADKERPPGEGPPTPSPSSP